MRLYASSSPAHPGAEREVRLARLCLPLAGVAACLVVAAPTLRAWVTLQRRTDPHYSDLILVVFDLNREGNVPTWFSITLLLLAALVAAVVAVLRRTRSRGALRWGVFAAVLATLSLDEGAGLHEHFLNRVGSEALGDAATGLLLHAWVLPGIFIGAALLVGHLRLARDLPGRLRVRFVLAAAVFFGGALGLESLGALVLDRSGDALGYVVVTTLEEGAELAGVILLLYTLLELVRVRVGDEEVQLSLALP